MYTLVSPIVIIVLPAFDLLHLHLKNDGSNNYYYVPVRDPFMQPLTRLSDFTSHHSISHEASWESFTTTMSCKITMHDQ